MLNMSKFEDFDKAIRKLGGVLEVEKTEMTRDSAIKRFELCFDLAWKTIKDWNAIPLENVLKPSSS